MRDAHLDIIEQAREDKQYLCGRCRYVLDGVPIDEQRAIVCPECGYAMSFVVSVRLVGDNPEHDQRVRQSLGRTERIIIRLSVLFIVLVFIAVVFLVIF